MDCFERDGLVLQRSLAKNDLRDDPCGDCHQHIVRTQLHPMLATWWGTEVVVTPIVDHVLVSTLIGWQPVALEEAPIWARTAPSVCCVRPVARMLRGR